MAQRDKRGLTIFLRELVNNIEKEDISEYGIDISEILSLALDINMMQLKGGYNSYESLESRFEFPMVVYDLDKREDRSISVDEVNSFDFFELNHFFYKKYDLAISELKKTLHISNKALEDNETIKMENVIDNVEFMNLQKRMLLNVLLVLNKTGYINRLIEFENTNIDVINRFLSDKNQLHKINYYELLKRLYYLDMSKKEDIVQLLLINRQFLNKLGHNYEENLCFNLFKKSKTKEKILQEYDEKISDNFVKVLNVLESSLSDEEKTQEIYNLVSKLNENKSRKIIFQSVKQMLGMYKNAPEKFKDAATNLNNNFSNDKLERDKIIGIYARILDVDDIEKYDRVSYVVDLYYSLDGYLKDLYKEYKKGDRKISFKEFVSKFINESQDTLIELEAQSLKEIETIQNDQEKEKKLDSKITVIDIALKLKKFLQNVKYFDKSDLDDSFNEILKDYEIVNNLMLGKHISTMILFEEYVNGNKDIYMENNSPIDGSNTGVIDIYLDGYVQVFGGHYKNYDLEALDTRITELNLIIQDVDALFFSVPQELSLNLNIPMEKITTEQKEEFRRLAKTISFIEGKWVENDNNEFLMLQELQDYKRERKDEYQGLKIRILLGAGLEYFKDFYDIGKTITGQDIGEASFDADIDLCDHANEVLTKIVKLEEKGEKGKSE